MVIMLPPVVLRDLLGIFFVGILLRKDQLVVYIKAILLLQILFIAPGHNHSKETHSGMTIII